MAKTMTKGFFLLPDTPYLCVVINDDGDSNWFYEKTRMFSDDITLRRIEERAAKYGIFNRLPKDLQPDAERDSCVFMHIKSVNSVYYYMIVKKHSVHASRR